MTTIIWSLFTISSPLCLDADRLIQIMSLCLAQATLQVGLVWNIAQIWAQAVFLVPVTAAFDKDSVWFGPHRQSKMQFYAFSSGRCCFASGSGH